MLFCCQHIGFIILDNIKTFCSLYCEASTFLNSFSTNVLLLYPLKISENRKFPHVFRGYGSGTLFENGLIGPGVQVLFYEFCNSFENSFSIKLFWTAASGYSHHILKKFMRGIEKQTCESLYIIMLHTGLRNRNFSGFFWAAASILINPLFFANYDKVFLFFLYFDVVMLFHCL